MLNQKSTFDTQALTEIPEWPTTTHLDDVPSTIELQRHALLILVCALIVSKVDYCNSVLAGIPAQLQDRLQSVLNAVSRLVFSARTHNA